MAAAASPAFDASAAADAEQILRLVEFQEEFSRMIESIRAGETTLSDHKSDIRVFQVELSGVMSYLTDPVEKKRAEDYEIYIHSQKVREEADRKRYAHAKTCRDNAEVLTPSELEKRVKEGGLAEVYTLAGYGDYNFIGYYYVDDDHWITGPKEGNPDAHHTIYGLGWEAKHNEVTDRVTVEYGGEEWFVGFFSMINQAKNGLRNAVIRRLRELGCVTVG